jgi:hypothetical protein
MDGYTGSYYLYTLLHGMKGFKNLKIRLLSQRNISWLMWLWERLAVDSEEHAKPINTFCGKK